MLDTLCEHLLEKPRLYQDEMVLFLLDKFKAHVTTSSIGRVLASTKAGGIEIRPLSEHQNYNLENVTCNNRNTDQICTENYILIN